MRTDNTTERLYTLFYNYLDNSSNYKNESLQSYMFANDEEKILSILANDIDFNEAVDLDLVADFVINFDRSVSRDSRYDLADDCNRKLKKMILSYYNDLLENVFIEAIANVGLADEIDSGRIDHE